MVFSGCWPPAGSTENFCNFCAKKSSPGNLPKIRVYWNRLFAKFQFFGLRSIQNWKKSPKFAFLGHNNARNILKLFKNIWKRVFATRRGPKNTFSTSHPRLGGGESTLLVSDFYCIYLRNFGKIVPTTDNTTGRRERGGERLCMYDSILQFSWTA